MIVVKNKYLFYLSVITFVLMFFTALVINIGSIFISIYFIFESILIFLFLNLKKRNFLKFVINLKNIKLIKVFYIFIGFCILSVFLSLLYHYFSLSSFFTGIVGNLIFSIVFPYLLILYITSYVFKKKFTIKLFYLTIFFIFLIGIIEFFVFLYDIPFLKDCIDFLSRRRTLLGSSVSGIYEVTRYYIGIFPRIRAIFDEPASLSEFIFFISPFVYNYSLSSNKIFNLKNEQIFKKIFLSMMIFNIFFTGSPIYIILFIISTLICTYKQIYRFLKNNFLKVLFASLISILIIIFFVQGVLNINISETFIIRIINTLKSFGSYEYFSLLEPSLATRITCYINAFVLFLKHPILGVGYSSLVKALYIQLANSPVVLTEELSHRLINNSGFGFPMAYMFRLFAETGLIGVVLFLSFLGINFYYVNKLIKKFSGIDKIFLTSIKISLINLFIMSWYSNITYSHVWLVLAFIPSYYIYYKRLIKNIKE